MCQEAEAAAARAEVVAQARRILRQQRADKELAAALGLGDLVALEVLEACTRAQAMGASLAVCTVRVLIRGFLIHGMFNTWIFRPLLYTNGLCFILTALM